jgi:hypothetical protein
LEARVLSLICFEHELDRVLPLHEAGLREFMVDHETRDKERRQLGADTEINHAPLKAVAPIAKLEGVRVHCRINSWGPQSADEIDQAIDCGASRIYLPMVQGPAEVEAYLHAVNRRAEAAIMIETDETAKDSAAFADLPIDAIFVGLMDLAISRQQTFIFSALRDGTVQKVRQGLPGPSFGFGGATCVDGGAPIPFPLLLGELAALGGEFTFLRRSFRRDIAGRDPAVEIQRIHALWAQLKARTPEEVQRDREALYGLVGTLEP